jgi:uncharacterized protein YacL
MSLPSSSGPADDVSSAEPAAAGAGKDPTGKIEQLKIVGGLVALASGLVALVLVVMVALLVKPDTTGGSIATSAIGVIGSVVGAYFGMKIGSDGTQSAIKAQQQEAAKAHVSALHTPPEKATEVVAQTVEIMDAQQTR